MLSRGKRHERQGSGVGAFTSKEVAEVPLRIASKFLRKEEERGGKKK